MKIGKREKNAIIINFIFYSILMAGLIFYIVGNLIPEALSIEEKKVETKQIFKTIQKIKKEGLTYEEFTTINSKGEKSRVISEILNSMSEEFYNENLTNKDNSNYSDFLKTVYNNLNNPENQAIVELQKKQIAKILPSYSEEMIDFGEDRLTDYKFVNYIESIIETFNFTNSNSIGISKVVLLKDYAIGKEKGKGLDSNIYYIPLRLNLKGTKTGIIEFLYFIENVGNISVKDDKILLNKDFNFLSKNGIIKVLEGDRYSSDYNIFEHQIADIEKITIKDYMDSSYISRGNKDFKEFIINTQGDEKFEISVNLMFYVKGLPTYIIEEFIKKVISDYSKINKMVTNKLKDTDLKIVERIRLNKYNATLKQLKKELDNIRKGMNKKDNLEGVYKRAVRIDEVLKPMFKSLKK